MKNKERQYYPGISLLKFTASIIIVLHHYYLNTNLEFLQIFRHGWIFVELFFMISGFLAFRGGAISHMPYYKYIAHVIRKFFPMILFSIFIYTMLGIFYYLKIGNWYRNVSIDFWVIITSLLLQFAGGSVGNVSLGINNPIWFVCVLLICHSFLYIIQQISEKYKFPFAYSFIIMVFLGVSAMTYRINLPFFNVVVARGYYSFFTGCIISLLLEKRKNCFEIYKFAAVVCFLYVLPKLLGFSFMYNNWNLSATFILFPAIVIICALPLNSEKLNKISAFFAGLSFEIYIWHGVLLLIQGLLYECKTIKYDIYVFAGFLTITIITTLFIYIVIEKKLNSFFWAKTKLFFDKHA